MLQSNAGPSSFDIDTTKSIPNTNGSILDCFWPSGFRIKDKNHEHASETDKAAILAIDTEIQNLLEENAPGTECAISEKLEALLNKPFFGPRNFPSERMVDLFDKLDGCPINPNRSDAENHAEQFIQGLSRLLQEHAPGAKLPDENVKNSIIDYLKSNRSTRSEFEHMLCKLDGDNIRGSAQKMALETFAKAFPYTQSQKKYHLPVLKKLVEILPNLEHDDIIEHNPQRRGVYALRKALDTLDSPNDVAEISACLMDRLGALSQKLSRHHLNKHDIRQDAVILATGFGLQIAGFAAVTYPMLAPLLAAPLVGGPFMFHVTTKKQPQGTALFLLKDQLENLRANWAKVDPKHRQMVIQAFENLKSNFHELAGTKPSTLKRFFNDDFIDPSTFKTETNSIAEFGKNIFHSFSAPINTTLRVDIRSMKGYETTTRPQRELVDILMRYHSEGRKAGLASHLPDDFLKHFIRKIQTPELSANGVIYARDAFARVKEIPEYLHPLRRKQILSQVIEMTKRLADGDEAFVREFVSVCRVANENCHNNARQILKGLNNCVIADKALKGEDGLNRYDNLIALGRSFFHEQELNSATREIITHNKNAPLQSDKIDSVGVEIGNAVHIALDGKLGIRDPIQGMGYTDTVRKIVTPEKLQEVETLVNQKIDNKDAFTSFLMNWTPLTNKIIESSEFEQNKNTTLLKITEKYERAEKAYFGRHEMPEKDKETAEKQFEAAGVEYQSTSKEIDAHVLRKIVGELVDRYPAERTPRTSETIAKDTKGKAPMVETPISRNQGGVRISG